MDFASILSSEITKKRKEAPSTSITTPAEAPAPAKKYLKRSELEAQRQAEYAARQQELAEQRAQKAAEKRRAEEEAARKREEAREKQRRLAEERRLREEELGGKKKDDDEGNREEGAGAQEEMTDEEAIAKLRELGQPAKLFGESTAGRVKRCKRAIAAREAAIDPLDSPLPLISEEEMRVDIANVNKDPELVYRQLDAWFRLVMKEWKTALDERPMAVKESFQGRKAADAMQQAEEYMKPLFRHFKHRDLKANVFEKVCEIVVEAQARRYVKANDVYLKLSIGNAAWPIGVTMVGIHERSAREKLHENQKDGAAHIMSDEVTRKFLQSIKRCLSFCQTRWPPEDPLQLMG
ncbi:Prp18 domain-containing protein [Sphaerosporella brunnea]|uniref:Pre-mRNA-splicing factor 18 n=1 Tax=Sphaerosporella brunnea TaxID=1250544 RepID=A0A5J5F2C8_9PEZI|nr:Prp18 domain-containing protein [Sphaerosporella brunnea]